MKLPQPLHIIVTCCAACALALLPAPAAHGCAAIDLQSVHFNTLRPDFGTPVRRVPRGFWDSGLWSVPDDDAPASERNYLNRRFAASDSARFTDWYGGYDSGDDQKSDLDNLYAKLSTQTQADDWLQARKTCVEIVHRAGKWSGNLRDTVGLIDAIIARRSVSSSERRLIRMYLGAVELERLGQFEPAKFVLKRCGSKPGSKFLADRICYQRACADYESNDRDEALKLFRRCVDKYPTSTKREESLIMIGRISILDAAPSQTAIETGLAAIRQLLASYPHTRFYMSAFGLRARVHFLRGQFADALWCYYRLDDLESVRTICETMPNGMAGPNLLHLFEAYLARINDKVSYDFDRDLVAVRQVNKLRNRMSLEMIRRFKADLQGSPSLLVCYIYYRLYYTNTRIQDLANLADLASAALKRSPKTTFGDVIAVRLAEVEYQRQRYPECIAWAARALAVTQRYDRALFIRASAEEKLHRLARAHSDLTSALSVSKNDALRTGARQLLALVSEQEGDFSEALNQYWALGYDFDAAYLLDVRMSPAQISRYLPTCDNIHNEDVFQGEYSSNAAPKSVQVRYTRRQYLQYTLGIRYLRLGKWADAERWLMAVPASVRGGFDFGRREWGSSPSPDALTAVRDLRRLEAIAKHVSGYEARATAAYRYASYYHNHGALLLYNPILWKESRVYRFELYWNWRCQNTADLDSLKGYFAGHEIYLRSRDLCLAVAKQFPKSRVAPQALYRAACASFRYGALASWYEGRTKSFRYTPSGEPTALMRRLASRYPHSPLVPNALKYAEVFAANAHPAEWPHYATVQPRNTQRQETTHADSEVSDAESMLAENAY